MKSKLTGGKRSAEHVVKDIRRTTRRHFSSEDKIRIVLDGLRGEDSIAELCRKEEIAQSLYYTWSKEFLEAGKRRLAGETATEVITYTVDDGNGGSGTATLTITINGANDVPVVIDPLNPGTPDNPVPAAVPGDVADPQTGTDAIPVSPVDVSVYFVDPDGEPLMFIADGLPPGLTIDPVTGVIAGTPDSDASVGGAGGTGLYRVTIFAVDPDGGVAELTFDWQIVNQPPVLISMPPEQFVQEGEPFELDVAEFFDDPDNDQLTYTASGLPDGMTMDPATGQLFGTPASDAIAQSPNQNGTYVISVMVNDGQGGTALLTFDFTIRPLPAPGPDSPHGPEHDPGPLGPMFENHAGLTVDDAVAYAGPSGSDAVFEADHVIDQVVKYINRTWMDDRLDDDVYAGQDLDVAFGNGNERIQLRTMIWQGRIFVEMGSAFGAQTEWSVRGLDGEPLPAWIAMRADNLAVIDAPAGSDSFSLIVEMKLPDGKLVSLPISIDRLSGEITQLQSALITLGAEAPIQEQMAWMLDQRLVANARLVQALKG